MTSWNMHRCTRTRPVPLESVGRTVEIDADALADRTAPSRPRLASDSSPSIPHEKHGRIWKGVRTGQGGDLESSKRGEP